ncbi:MAG: hypothetical protein ABGZ49_04600 [Akkermansiaceae bacterium]|mgnify:FL=1
MQIAIDLMIAERHDGLPHFRSAGPEFIEAGVLGVPRAVEAIGRASRFITTSNNTNTVNSFRMAIRLCSHFWGLASSWNCG